MTTTTLVCNQLERRLSQAQKLLALQPVDISLHLHMMILQSRAGRQTIVIVQPVIVEVFSTALCAILSQLSVDHYKNQCVSLSSFLHRLALCTFFLSMRFSHFYMANNLYDPYANYTNRSSSLIYRESTVLLPIQKGGTLMQGSLLQPSLIHSKKRALSCSMCICFPHTQTRLNDDSYLKHGENYLLL